MCRSRTRRGRTWIRASAASARQREQAREHLTAATTMYREPDMRFWLEQAEAEILGPQ